MHKLKNKGIMSYTTILQLMLLYYVYVITLIITFIDFTQVNMSTQLEMIKFDRTFEEIHMNENGLHYYVVQSL